MRNLLVWCLRDRSAAVLSSHLNIQIYPIQRLYGTDANVVNVDETTTTDGTNAENPQKLVRVAVIGTPNAGKSTFINSVVNHRICATSKKVHTTRTFAKAIQNDKDCQMILFDTPGLVTQTEMKKFNLSPTFVSSCRHSIQHADLIAVVHDVSNSYTRNTLSESVINTLNEYQKLPSILVLNKVDLLRSKRILLDLVKILTQNTLVCKNRRYLPWDHSGRFEKEMSRPIKYKNEKPMGWPNFTDVFMVSALTGDGIRGLTKYIYGKSTDKPWEHSPEEFTDQKPEDLAVNITRAVLMDFLPQEIPYKLRIEPELFETKKDKMIIYVNVICPNKRIEKLVSGENNGKLKQISEVATSDLVKVYKKTVSLVVCVKSEDNGKKKT